MIPLGFIILLICVLCIYHICTSLLSRIQFRRFEKQQNCSPVYDSSNPAHTGRPAWTFPGTRIPLPYFIASMLDGWARGKAVIRVMGKGGSGNFLDDVFGAEFVKAGPQVTTMKIKLFTGETVIFTLDPANLQAMLATQFHDYETGQRRLNQFGPMLGKSIFSSDGSFWEHSRAMFRPQFNRENINNLESTEQASQLLIRALGDPDQTIGWTSPTEVLPLFYNFTLDTVTSFLFGESAGSQALEVQHRSSPTPLSTSPNPLGTQFKDDIAIANEYLLRRIQFAGMYFLADGLHFRRAVHRIRSFTETYVQRALSTAPPPPNKLKQTNLLASLATQTLSTTELRDQTLSILFAGRDTTAALLGWTLARLALHPQIYTALRASILTHFPPSPAPITSQTLKACRPLQNLLHEVLRLHPLVPINNRLAAHNTTLPRGGGPDGSHPIALAKGQIVLFSVYLLHRRTDLWGADALEFKPERWDTRSPAAWQFLPFSGGPRVCIGQQYAMTEAAYVLVRLVQAFDRVEPRDCEEMQRLKIGVGLTMWPGDQVPVRFHRGGEGM